MSSTFGSFNTVRLGIYAAQKGLDVTGNNITNINTTGYTRQRLDQVSLVTSAADRYYSPYKTRVGQGVLTTGVSQLRDPSLDITYRKASSDLGAADAKLAGLEDIAQVLDEVGKGENGFDDGVLLNRLNDLRDLINQALTNGLDEYEASIRTAASDLCTLFHNAANGLADKLEKYQDRLNEQVDTINGILAQLRDLNVTIRDADIRGDEALELRDQRNLLLDQLSQYVKINVTYTEEDLGAGLVVERMNVSLATGDRNTLVDGEYATQFSLGTPSYSEAGGGYEIRDENGNVTGYTKDWALATLSANANYGVTLQPMRDGDGLLAKADDLSSAANAHAPLADGAAGMDGLPLGDTDLYGALQSTREMLTEAGTYALDGADDVDPDALIKRGIPYYQKALDSLAHEFADAMNDININHGGGGALFSTSSTNDTLTDITAANISVSKSWGEGTTHMMAADPTSTASGDTSNLAKFLALFDTEYEFNPNDVAGGDALGASYHGTFEDMLLSIQSTLAEDQMTATSTLNNYSTTLSEVYTDRESVMGVDLNDEATSLMVYQKAYTAACRLMTVLEEALDSLINGTVV